MKDNVLEEVIDELAQRFGRSPVITVGAFTREDADEFDQDRQEHLDLKGALDFAQYAAAAAEKTSSGIHHFTPWTPRDVIYSWGQSNEPAQAEKDYETFKRLRAVNSFLENQMAIMYYGASRLEQANAAIDRALALHPDAIIWLNAVAIRYWNGKLAEALETYRETRRQFPNHVLSNNHQVVIPETLYRIYRANVGPLERAEILPLLKAALGSASITPESSTRIKKAIVDLENAATAN